MAKTTSNLKDQPTEELERQLHLIQEELRKRQCESSLRHICLPGLPCQQQARDILSKIFGKCITESRKVYNLIRKSHFPVEQALFLCRAHPSLTSEAFFGRTVLSFFLQTRASLAVTTELCAMYRLQATWMPTLADVGPIDDWKKYCDQNAPPLSDWVYSKLAREPNFIFDACIYGATKGVMKLLIEQFPHQLLRLGLGREFDHQKYYDPPEEIIPHKVLLEHFITPPFRIRTMQDENDFLEHGEDSDFVWLFRPRLEELMDMMDTALSYCPDLLSHCNVQRRVDESLMNDCYASASQRYLFEKFSRYQTNFGSLNLRYMPRMGIRHVQVLRPLISKTTHFSGLPEGYEEEGFSALLPCLTGQPRVQELSLEVTDELLEKGGHRLIELATCFPNLSRLVLPSEWGYHGRDATQCLLTILKKTSAQTMDLQRLKFDIRAIFGALATNTSLENLQLLEWDGEKEAQLVGVLRSSNVTLQKLQIVSRRYSRSGNNELDMLLLLNQCGRAKLHHDGCSLLDLIKSLSSSVLSDIDNVPGCAADLALRRHSVKYELLRMVPALWSSANPCKRKRG